jgi:hypothetical protein
MPCKSKCAGACGGGAGSAPKASVKPKEEKRVDVKTLKSYKALTERFGPDLEAKYLLSLAAHAVETNPRLKKPGRAEERNTEKLYLWFDANWAKIADKLDDLDLLDEEEEEEDLDDQA